MRTEDRIANVLIDIEAISLNTKKPFEFVSGIRSPIYTDCRIIMSYPNEREVVITEMIKILKNIGFQNIDVIAGVSTSGIPFAAWLSEKVDKPLIYIRKGSKEHGMQNSIEGVLKKGQRAILIEDLVSTAKSSINCIKSIRKSGGIVEHQISIFTYELSESIENFKEIGVTASSLTNYTSLINVLIKRGTLKKNAKNLILGWKN